VPLTAPFGGGFVAWEPPAVRRAWIERTGITDPRVKVRLEAALMAIRQRGFSIERMSSSARQVLDLASDLHAGVASEAMRESIARLLVEITSASHLPDDLHDTPKAYVSTIAAPVFDRSGKAALNVGVHPFRALSGRRIEQVGRALVRATDRISGRSAADRDDTH
jgi:DNA-binding IclR family transcriptional regulator